MTDRLIITLERGGLRISWLSQATSELDWDTIATVLAAELVDILKKKPELLRDEETDEETDDDSGPTD